MTIGKLMSVTTGLIVLYLLIADGGGAASKVVLAFTDFYTGTVRLLQGRKP